MDQRTRRYDKNGAVERRGDELAGIDTDFKIKANSLPIVEL